MSFNESASTEKPKNGHLASDLGMLLTWARMRKPLDLDGTNWMRHDNDNYAEGEDRPASNLQRRIRPGSTDAELRSFIEKAGPLGVRKHARLGGGGAWEVEPTDVTRQVVPDKTDKDGTLRRSHRTVVRAGKLRIANGQTKIGADRIEEGTVLHQPDKFGEMLGPEPNPAEKVRSATYWSSLYKVDRSSLVETGEDGSEKLRFIPRGTPHAQVLAAADVPCDLAAHVPDRRMRKFMSHHAELAAVAARQALHQANPTARGIAPERMGLYAGVGLAAVQVIRQPW